MDETWWQGVVDSAPDGLLAPLRNVVEIGADTPAQAKAALDALVYEQALRGLVTAWELDQESTALLLERLAVRHGLRGHTDKLRHLLVSLRRKRKADDARDRVAKLTTGSLRDGLRNPDLPAGLQAAPGWEIRDDGVFRLHEDPETGTPPFECIALQPILITALLLDLRARNAQLRLR